MRIKNLSYFLFALLMAFAACKNDKAEKKQDNSDESYIEQDYFFPPEVYYFRSREDYLVDKFYPIGWSKQGYFAYITEPVAEGLGNYVMELTVINILNGDTLWYWHSPYDQDLVREEVWKNNYQLFKTILNRYRIIQLKEPHLLSPYFNYQGEDYSVELQTSFHKQPGYGFEAVRHTRIILRSPQNGVKIAYDADLPSNSIIINQTIAGVMQSPFDDKIAIILQQERPGYEGPPNVITFRIIGTNLLTGWNNHLN